MEIWLYLGAAVAALLYWRRRKAARKKAKAARAPSRPQRTTPEPSQTPSQSAAYDPLRRQKAQLAAVVQATYAPRRLMNRGEYQAFQAAEQTVSRMRQGHRVFAQVSLGEILAVKDDEAFRAINSKRVDILVTDRFGQPAVAIEYQGSGHYLSKDAELRDSIKRLALESAGIHYLPVHPPLDNQALASQLTNRLREGAMPSRSTVQHTA